MADQLRLVGDDEFERIRKSLVCVHDDEFERDTKIILDEYVSSYQFDKKVPTLSELEGIVTSINWSISYDMADFLTDNDDTYIAELREWERRELSDRGRLSSEERQEILDDVRSEFISEQCGQLFNDLYWYHTQEIRDLLRQILTEAFIVYVDDLADNPILYMILECMDSHRVYANNAQIIMFESLYESEYGKGSLCPTDAGHTCNHLILRKDGYVKDKFMLENKEMD